MKEKDIWIKFKKYNKIVQRLPIRVSIIVVSFTLIKNVIS